MSIAKQHFFLEILVLPCSEDESILFSFISVVMMAQSLQGAASSLASRTLLLEVEAIALLHNNKHYVHIIILYTTILYYSRYMYIIWSFSLGGFTVIINSLLPPALIAAPLVTSWGHHRGRQRLKFQPRTTLHRDLFQSVTGWWLEVIVVISSWLLDINWPVW